MLQLFNTLKALTRVPRRESVLNKYKLVLLLFCLYINLEEGREGGRNRGREEGQKRRREMRRRRGEEASESGGEMQKERDRYSRTAKRGQGVIDWSSKRNQSCEWKAQG